MQRCLPARSSNQRSAKGTPPYPTYNIHAWRDGDHVDNLQRAADTCLAVDADVICLNGGAAAVRRRAPARVLL